MTDTDRSISPVLYFPHGGGPLPLLGDKDHQNMVDFLRRMTPHLGEPSAILVISAHWEERQATITSGEFPKIIYDYYGFPEESYQITYPAPGDPALARRIYELLRKNGIEARMDGHRGFDHGLFVPLKIMYPAAHIPCVQLSLLEGLDPAAHIRLGKALSALRDHNVLILGSGFSFHNLRAFFSSNDGQPDSKNESFQRWLIETCTDKTLSQKVREGKLVDWQSAPSARYCHPREEHLIPLHVCSGVTGSPASVVFDGEVLGKRAIGLLWET
jgi:4,5-DOPA dioxygenase extradiol